jgi:hemerythrin-like metal-binding protein
MAFFEWADDLVIDKGPIDADHLQLVDLVNELHSATTQGLGHTVVEEIMERLLAYTRQHFYREEQIMSSVHFPRLREHQGAHKKIIDQLDALKSKHEGGSVTVASQLSTVLRDWLSVHIRRADKELLVYLKKERRI